MRAVNCGIAHRNANRRADFDGFAINDERMADRFDNSEAVRSKRRSERYNDCFKIFR